MSRRPHVLTVGDTVTVDTLRLTVDGVMGQGSFGCVYRVKDPRGRTFALKAENLVHGGFSQLAHENKVYRLLRGVHGVPTIHGFAPNAAHGMSYLVMDLLGPNLQEVLENAPHKRVPLRQTCIITMRILDRLVDMHRIGLLHRDVKPQNFLLANDLAGGGRSSVWAVDFGLVKPFRDRHGVHVPYRDNKPGLTGTPRFASTFAHAGHESSRRDDIESLMYVAAYLFKGKLPWQNLPRIPNIDPRSAEGKRLKNARVYELKQNHDPDELFEGMPRFAGLARYVRELVFDAVPDYAFIRREVKATYDATQPR